MKQTYFTTNLSFENMSDFLLSLQSQRCKIGVGCVHEKQKQEKQKIQPGEGIWLQTDYP